MTNSSKKAASRPALRSSRLDSRRIACRGHLHCHDRSGQPQGRPPREHSRSRLARESQPRRLGRQHAVPLGPRRLARRNIGQRRGRTGSSARQEPHCGPRCGRPDAGRHRFRARLSGRHGRLQRHERRFIAQYFSKGPGVRTTLMPSSGHEQQRNARRRLVHRGQNAAGEVGVFEDRGQKSEVSGQS